MVEVVEIDDEYDRYATEAAHLAIKLGEPDEFLSIIDTAVNDSMGLNTPTVLLEEFSDCLHSNLVSMVQKMIEDGDLFEPRQSPIG